MKEYSDLRVKVLSESDFANSMNNKGCFGKRLNPYIVNYDESMFKNNTSQEKNTKYEAKQTLGFRIMIQLPLIISFCDARYKNVALNWVCCLKKIKIDNYLIITLDNDAESFLKKIILKQN